MKFDIKRLGKLAKLNLTEAEVAKFDKQINEMLNLIKVLPQVPQSDKNKINGEQKCMLREDIVKKSFSIEETLSNAPEKKAGYFSIPNAR